MKRGDLVIKNRSHIPEDNWFRDAWLRPGIILTWVRYGGPEGTVWEVLYPDGIEHWDESDLRCSVKVGDLVQAIPIQKDRIPEVGIIIEVIDHIEVPPVVKVLWPGGIIDKEWTDELAVVE